MSARNCSRKHISSFPVSPSQLKVGLSIFIIGYLALVSVECCYVGKAIAVLTISKG